MFSRRIALLALSATLLLGSRFQAQAFYGSTQPSTILAPSTNLFLAATKIDLYIADLSWVEVNSRACLQVTIGRVGYRNNGSFNVRVTGQGVISGNSFNINQTQSMGVGFLGSGKLLFDVGTFGHCTSYSVSVSVDVNNTISESNEGNNWDHAEYEFPC